MRAAVRSVRAVAEFRIRLTENTRRVFHEIFRYFLVNHVEIGYPMCLLAF